MSNVDVIIDTIDGFILTDGEQTAPSLSSQEEQATFLKLFDEKITLALETSKYLLAIWSEAMKLSQAWRDWFLETGASEIMAYIAMSVALALVIRGLLKLIFKKEKNIKDLFAGLILLALSGVLVAMMVATASLAPMLKVVTQSLVIFAEAIALIEVFKKWRVAPKGTEEAMACRQSAVKHFSNIALSMAIITLTLPAFITVAWPLVVATVVVALSLLMIKLCFNLLSESNKRTLKSFFGFGKESYAKDESLVEPIGQERPTTELQPESLTEERSTVDGDFTKGARSPAFTAPLSPGSSSSFFYGPVLSHASREEVARSRKDLQSMRHDASPTHHDEALTPRFIL